MIGAVNALTSFNLLLIAVGCLSGMLIGMLPGLGPISAIALLIPVSYALSPESGIIMLAGVYYGAIFGGSTSSILLNAPGVAGTVATAFDGYPMARQGQAGKALAIAAYASFIGGTIGVILLMMLAPQLAKFTLAFQSPEYFMLMVLGLSLVFAFADEGDHLKALAMVLFGLSLATVGTDRASGLPRFTFGSMDLMDGFSFLVLAMGTFAMTEAVYMASKARIQPEQGPSFRLRSLALNRTTTSTIAPAVGRGSLLGFFIGTLPGAGATMASFLAYGLEKSFPKPDETAMGSGNARGLAAPEAANNAACTGSFVPLLTLGIPGSGTTAILLGAFIAYGIQPGPQLYIEMPSLFWTVVISMYIGNLILLFLNLPLIPYIARLLIVPRSLLAPLILMFSVAGVYLVSFNSSDLVILAGITITALILRWGGYPMAPVLLGFILGGLLEDNLRRTLMLSNGELSFFLERPTFIILSSMTLLIISLPIIRLGLKRHMSTRAS